MVMEIVRPRRSEVFKETSPVGADQIEQRYPYSLGAISNCAECSAAFPSRRLDEDMDFIVLHHATHRLRDRRIAEVAALMKRHGERWR